MACCTRPSLFDELVIDDSYHLAKESAIPLVSVFVGAVFINE